MKPSARHPQSSLPLLAWIAQWKHSQGTGVSDVVSPKFLPFLNPVYFLSLFIYWVYRVWVGGRQMRGTCV